MMKRKITIFLLLLVSIFAFLFNNYSTSASTGKTVFYKDSENGILAYKQINAFQLQLSDGRVLSNMSLTTGSDVTVEENLKDVEIVFVLDNSGSMSGNRIQTLKSATQELVTKLFDKIGEEHLKFGFVKFASSQLGKLSLTKNKAQISSFISGMKASGGTHMSGSLNTALEMLTSSSNSDAIKMIITLSDGALADESATINTFSQVHNKSISTISIFVETSITRAFSNLASKSSLHKNMQTSTSNMADTIVNRIYQEIYMKIILLSDPNTTFNLNNAGIIPGDDKIILQVDAEILHGATLYIEYIISVTSAFDTKNIVIEDIPDISLRYNANQKLLTENKTNSSYGWTYQNESGHLISESGNKVQKAGNAYTKKLLLSTVLTSEVFNSSSTFGNSAKISLENATNGNKINIDKSTSDDSGLVALKFLIIPPTGVETKTFDFCNVFLINVSVIVIFTCIFLLSYIFFKIIKNKGS